MKIKKMLTALCAGAVFTAGIPCTASASSLSKDELREKYADVIAYGLENGGADFWYYRVWIDRYGIGDNDIDYGPEFANMTVVYHNDYCVQQPLSLEVCYFGDYEEYDNYYYVVKPDHTIKLIGADWEELRALNTEKLEIPSEIEGMPVNELDKACFAYADYHLPMLQEIVLPDSITIIRACALCAALEGWDYDGTPKINIPSKVEYLGSQCYSSLGFALGEKIILPETVEYIDSNAFLGSIVTEIVEPESNFVSLKGAINYTDANSVEIHKNGTYSSDKVMLLLGDNCVTMDDSCYGKAAHEKAERERKEAEEELKRRIFGDPDEEDEQEGETFAEKGPQTAAVLSVGDIDENGEVNVLDSVLLARLVVDDTELELSDAGKANADLNGDGVVTHDDLTLSLKTLAKQ